MRRLTLALVLLVGCSRGGGSGGGSTSSGSTSSSTDAALATALAGAGITRLTPPAADSPALVDLGRNLFFDKVISGNRNISCGSCHQMTQATATGDGLPVAMGEGATGDGALRTLNNGKLIARNAQPIFNAGLPGMTTLFWDLRVSQDPITGALLTTDFLLNGLTPGRPQITALLTSALAAQAMFPPTVPEEMRGQAGSNELANTVTNEDVWTLIMARLVGTQNGTVGGIAGYRTKFMAAYPSVTSFDDFNFGHSAQAIAAFERTTFTALQSPFDAYLAGNRQALTDGQKRGALLFLGKARCASCHSGPLLTDLAPHGVAVPQLGPGKNEPNDDRGRALITGLVSDNYKFRTPPLRNVAATGPWMHDGAFTTLAGAVRHHLDPATGIKSYDATQLPPVFAATVDTDPTRIAARIAAIDPLLGAPNALADSEVADLLDFLGSLTDSASLSAGLNAAPSSVPSGLPIPD
jgi:cytochrome c peroxidase